MAAVGILCLRRTPAQAQHTSCSAPGRLVPCLV